MCVCVCFKFGYLVVVGEVVAAASAIGHADFLKENTQRRLRMDKREREREFVLFVCLFEMDEKKMEPKKWRRASENVSSTKYPKKDDRPLMEGAKQETISITAGINQETNWNWKWSFPQAQRRRDQRVCFFFNRTNRKKTTTTTTTTKDGGKRRMRRAIKNKCQPRQGQDIKSTDVVLRRRSIDRSKQVGIVSKNFK